METPLPSTPPAPCCSPKSKLICSSAGLVVLVLVAIASFVLGRALPRSPEGTLRGTPTTAILPTPTPTPTVYTEDSRSADWKTYTNPLKEFSFKYPHNWKLFYNSTNSSLKPFTKGQIELSFFGPRSGELQPGVLRDALEVDILDLRPADPNMDVKAQVLEYAKEYADPYYKDNITELTISGEKAFQTKVLTEGPESSMMPSVYIIGAEHKNKRLFIVVNIGVDMGSTEDYLKTLDLILSTFKFLN